MSTPSQNPFFLALSDIRSDQSLGYGSAYFWLRGGILAGMFYVVWDVINCWNHGKCINNFQTISIVVLVSTLATIYFLKSFLLYGLKTLKHGILQHATPQALTILGFVGENFYFFFAGIAYVLLMREFFISYSALHRCIRTNIDECPFLFKMLGTVAKSICGEIENSACFDWAVNIQFPLYAVLAYFVDYWFEDYLFQSETMSQEGPPANPVNPPPVGAQNVGTLALTPQALENALTTAMRSTRRHLLSEFKRTACKDCRQQINWETLAP